MSNLMRLLLLLAAVMAGIWILYQIRRLKIKLDHAIFWIIFAFILAVLGLFPELTYWLTEKLGLMSPANLVFLIIIALLLFKVFTLSMLVSQLDDKVTVLSAEIALRTLDAGRRPDRRDGAKEPPAEEMAGEAEVREAGGGPQAEQTDEPAAREQEKQERQERQRGHNGPGGKEGQA